MYQEIIPPPELSWQGFLTKIYGIIRIILIHRAPSLSSNGRSVGGLERRFQALYFERFLGAYSPQYVFSEFVRSRGPTSFYNQGIEKGPECLRVSNSYVKMVENVT